MAAKNNDNKMNLIKFKVWLESQGAICHPAGPRLNCVLGVDHIAPGLWAALWATQTPKGVVVVELNDYFPSREEAFAALDNPNSSSQFPLYYTQWIKEQYLTDKNAKVEKIEI